MDAACPVSAKRGSAPIRVWKGALLRGRSLTGLGWRIFAPIALATAVGFNYAVLAPTIGDIAGRFTNHVSPEMAMKSPPSFQSIPDRLQVRLRVIPEKQQRYDTSGDWLWTDGTLEIRVSREVADQDPRYAMLLFVHELIEALLCRSVGITAAQVDSFDMSHAQEDEPGDDPTAPYHHQHRAAEAAERALADKLGVNWKEYVTR